MQNTPSTTALNASRRLAPSTAHADWTLTVVTHALPERARSQLRAELAAFAATRGLAAQYSADAIAITAVDTAITDEDCGAVMGWLCARPEVRLVHVSRPRTSSACAVTFASKSRDSACPRAEHHDAHPCDEDVSQEPPWWQA
ncbi:hypothetical protein [Roseateles sp. BYS87W]|uniref:Uncharacterized protein n=1 Tax=Pelomonas baiyunensis TaxID=3299026 RepID=A0ABW7H391_9BURK